MTSAEDGYRRHREFFRRPPLLSIEWHDPETPAVGMLVINSLRGGAAGGGTRMRELPHPQRPGEVDLEALRDEATFLAKTMEIKFGVSGPPIGGAKSVLAFDHEDPRKRGVLERWFAAIGPYLRLCYGTGGDLHVDEIAEVIPLIGAAAGVEHPQQGVVVGHLRPRPEELASILANLTGGVSMAVELPDVPQVDVKLADLVTGYGVVEAAAAYYAGTGDSLEGKRVLVEGFGAVGGPAAYYCHRQGARVVGVVCKEGGELLWAVDPDGLDVPDLMARRRPGALLPADCSRGCSAEPFWSQPADLFIPAARSRGIDGSTLDRLRDAGVTVLSSGANNPFADPMLGEQAVQRRADAELVVLPDFIANCGMARAFAYLMQPAARVDAEAILADAGATIRGAVERVLEEGGGGPGFMGRALATFVPG